MRLTKVLAVSALAAAAMTAGAKACEIVHALDFKAEDGGYEISLNGVLVLADATGEGPVPPALDERFTETVAWHDHRVARGAIEAWNGEGWLVVLVDRTWVEGGLGMPWQAEQLTDVPVSGVLLADADTRCYAGDKVITSFLGLF